MIRVKVRSFLTMQEIIGDADITLSPENSTLDGLLKALCDRHGEKFRRLIFSPKTGKVRSYWIVVNGRHRPDTESTLQDGDEIILYPTWAGG